MKRPYKEFGKTLLGFRKAKFGDLGLKQIAPKLGIEYSYLNKLENGLQKPSVDVFNKIIDVYGLTDKEIEELQTSANFRWGVIRVEETKSHKSNTQTKYSEIRQETGVKLNVNPLQTPVLYTDNI